MDGKVSFLSKMQDYGCSPFFMTSAVISMANGSNNRKLALENARKDEAFKKLLSDNKEQFQDEKEAEDYAYKKWLKAKQREYLRIEASRKFDNELIKSDLKVFFSDWPLSLNVLSIPDIIKKHSPSLYFVVARHDVASNADPLSLEYYSVIGQLAELLSRVNINAENILSFNESSRRTGGPAIANIFAAMHTIPTVMVIPSINSLTGMMDFSIGLWGQDSTFPFNRQLFSIDYDKDRMLNNKEYKQCKLKEILFATTAITGVMNDTYNLLEYGKEPQFPLLAEAIGMKDYPVLVEFAKHEYESISSTTEISAYHSGKKIIANEELYTKRENDSIKRLANQSLAALNNL